jgi:hypothetical protein
MPDPTKFVEQNNQAQILKCTVKNWDRKIKIAEIAAKKAKTIFNQNGRYMDNQIEDQH